MKKTKSSKRLKKPLYKFSKRAWGHPLLKKTKSSKRLKKPLYKFSKRAWDTLYEKN
jgi:hypothetical protein